MCCCHGLVFNNLLLCILKRSFVEAGDTGKKSRSFTFLGFRFGFGQRDLEVRKEAELDSNEMKRFGESLRERFPGFYSSSEIMV